MAVRFRNSAKEPLISQRKLSSANTSTANTDSVMNWGTPGITKGMPLRKNI